MKAIQKPTTYEAEQFDGKNEKPIVKLLEGTGVRALPQGNWYGLPLQFPAPPYETHGYVENGPTRKVGPDSWVVVSSLGDVRILSAEAYDKEFYEDWETPETPETKIALLAHYVNKLVTLASDRGDLSVDLGDWSKLELMGRTAE
jgi:hypothetical protein